MVPQMCRQGRQPAWGAATARTAAHARAKGEHT